MLISLFTPVHICDCYTEQCLDSVVLQTNNNWEWIILDNSTNFEVADFVDKLIKTKYNIKYIELKQKIKIYKVFDKQRNIGYLKNICASLCVGDLLMELERDDILLPNAVECLIQAVEKNNDCKFFWSDCVMVDVINGECVSRIGAIFIDKYKVCVGKQGEVLCNASVLENIDYQRLIEYNNFPMHWRAWKRDFYHLIGGFDKTMNTNEDQDLILRTFLNCKNGEVCRIKWPGYIWFGHGNNCSTTDAQSIHILTQETNNKYKIELKKHFDKENADNGFIKIFEPNLKFKDVIKINE